MVGNYTGAAPFEYILSWASGSALMAPTWTGFAPSQVRGVGFAGIMVSVWGLGHAGGLLAWAGFQGHTRPVPVLTSA